MTKITDFTLLIPNADNTAVVRQITIHIPVVWDEEIEDWLLTEDAHKIIDAAKEYYRVAVPVKVHIFWGRCIEDGTTPTTYLFANEELKDAFIKGVDEAIGWMDYGFAEGPDEVWGEKEEEDE